MTAIKSSDVVKSGYMAKEVIPHDPRVQRILKQIEEEEAARRPEETEALRQSYLRLLAAYLPVVEELRPGELARELNEDLAKFGHDTLRLVEPETLKPVRWIDGKPQGPRLDILATHQATGFTCVWQVDSRIPLRDKVEGVNQVHPAPDLAIFALVRDPLPEEKLAVACRDVTCDFLVYWIGQANIVLTPAERDILRLEVELPQEERSADL